MMKEEKTIRVVYVEPDQYARVMDLGTELAEMQEAVGGDIEGIFPFSEQTCLVCNEMGKWQCKPNRTLKDSIGKPYLVICGAFFICDASGTHFGSLSDEQVQRYLKMFEFPERIGRTNGKLIAIPYDPRVNKKINREDR